MESAAFSLDLGIALPLLTLAAFLLLFVLKHRPSHALPFPPASRGFPFLGDTVRFLHCYRSNKFCEYIRSRVAKYGHVFRTLLLFRHTVFIHGAEANRFVYTNDGTLVDICLPRKFINLIGQNALVSLHGSNHKRLRRLVVPCLHPAALQTIVGRVDRLTRQHFADKWLGRGQITLYSLVRSHSMNVSTIALTNVEDSQTPLEIGKHVLAMNAGFLSLPLYIPGTTFYKAHAARASLTKILDVLISRRKKEMEVANSEFKDTLSILINAKDETGSHLTRNELHDIIINLMFGGNDTNSSSICTICKLMSENPECYDEVTKEQTAIAESMRKKHQAELSWADIREMNYTWAVVQESWRIQPIAIGTLRVAKKDIDYKGYRILKGWKILNSVAVSHMDEKYFPNPEKFDPSRFLNGTSPVSYAYAPFGGGPHMCPGADFVKMVILTYLHHLVLSFSWTPLKPKERVLLNPFPIPQDGFPIQIHQRK